MIRMILKLLVLPVCFILYLLSGLMDLVLRIYSFGAGILYTFLFVCLILALVSNQWKNFGILSGFLIGATILTVLLGIVGAIIEVWKEKVKAFLRA